MTCHFVLLVRVVRMATLTIAPAGQVLRAFFKGREVAVKRPIVELTLNDRDLKVFTREVSVQAKVRSVLASVRPPHVPHCI